MSKRWCLHREWACTSAAPKHTGVATHNAPQRALVHTQKPPPARTVKPQPHDRLTLYDESTGALTLPLTSNLTLASHYSHSMHTCVCSRVAAHRRAAEHGMLAEDAADSGGSHARIGDAGNRVTSGAVQQQGPQVEAPPANRLQRAQRVQALRQRRDAGRAPQQQVSAVDETLRSRRAEASGPRRCS